MTPKKPTPRARKGTFSIGGKRTTPRLLLALTEAVHEAISARARSRGVSVSEWIRVAIQRRLDGDSRAENDRLREACRAALPHHQCGHSAVGGLLRAALKESP